MPSSDAAARNPFEVLGLELAADDREVRSAYARKLREAMQAGIPDRVQEIQDAFVALRDAERRGQIARFLEKQAAVEPHLQRGRERLEEGRRQEALVEFLKALDALPDQEGLLLQVVEIELALRRFDAAVGHAERLIHAAPHNPAHHALLAVILGTKAQFAPAPMQKTSIWRSALNAVRKSEELGGGGSAMTILESQVLWNLTTYPLAERVLRQALEPVTEIKSAELGLFLSLLRVQCLTRQGKAVGRTLERIGSLLPDDPARRDSIGGELHAFAVEVMLRHPVEARACLELAGRACPDEPAIAAAIAECGVRQQEIKKKALRSEAQAARSPAPKERRFWSLSFGRWQIAVLTILLINSVRMCSSYSGRNSSTEFQPPGRTQPARKLRPEEYFPELKKAREALRPKKDVKSPAAPDFDPSSPTERPGAASPGSAGRAPRPDGTRSD